MKDLHPRLGAACIPALVLALASLGSCRGAYQSTELDPEAQLEIYVTTATYLYEDGSLVRAQDQAVKALVLDPENVAMRRMIGWIRVRLGKNEDLVIAESFFRKLMREGDESNATLLGMATTLERLGLAYDKTSRAYARGERRPEDGVPVETRTRELAKKARDHWADSLEFYERTLEAGEGSTNAMNGLQRVHALLGQYDESLAWSSELLRRSSEELGVWERMLTSEELTEKEEKLFQTNAAMAYRLQHETHLFAATLLQEIGRDLEAIPHMDAVIVASPDLAEAYSQRGQLYARLGENERAITDLDRYLELSEKAFEHPQIQQAFDIRKECQRKLQGR